MWVWNTLVFFFVQNAWEDFSPFNLVGNSCCIKFCLVYKSTYVCKHLFQMELFGRHIWCYVFAGWISLDIWRRLVSLCRWQTKNVDKTTNLIEPCKHIISQLGWASFFLLFLFCFSLWILHVCRFRSLWGSGQRKFVQQAVKELLVLCGCPSQVRVWRSDHRLGAGTWHTQRLDWINVVILHGLIPVCPGLSCNGIGIALGAIFHLSENEFSSKYCTRRSCREYQSSACWTCWSLKSLLANIAEGLPAKLG